MQLKNLFVTVFYCQTFPSQKYSKFYSHMVQIAHYHNSKFLWWFARPRLLGSERNNLLYTPTIDATCPCINRSKEWKTQGQSYASVIIRKKLINQVKYLRWERKMYVSKKFGPVKWIARNGEYVTPTISPVAHRRLIRLLLLSPWHLFSSLPYLISHQAHSPDNRQLVACRNKIKLSEIERKIVHWCITSLKNPCFAVKNETAKLKKQAQQFNFEHHEISYLWQ